MKRIVAPKRWSAVNRVEHPPLMPKQLLQGVCGGLRWLESKNLAEFLAKRAIEEGFPCTKKQQRVFDARLPSSRPAHRKRRLHKKCPARRSGGDVQLTEGSLEAQRTTGVSGALVSSGALLALNSSAFDALAPLAKRKRLVSYDVLDCTFGSGFHTGVVLENGRPYTRVVAMDCDVEATVSAREIVDEFGADRFRFYARPMSEAKAMFGERSFDAVMIDPGPSLTQLENPERGFLLDDESDHALDMRYGPTHGLGALEYLNTVPQHALSGALASYELLTPQQSMKLARAIRQRRPFDGAQRVLEAVEEAGNELPEEGWGTQDSRRKTSMSWNFMTSLRCIVNHERHELSEALQNALLLLRTDGRLVVFSRLPWEEKLISTTISQHPHALLSYSEAIPIEDVQDHGHSRHTKMWIATRTQSSSYVLKNSQALTEEAVQESSMRWMSGLFAGQTFGFPANNFTFENKDGKDWAAVRRNKDSPPFDSDDDPRG
ncbi:S-adenosyl-methyltransferase mraW-like protein [Leishmania infantum JPCM5]|uniref:S-adenosyl-methyltransferase_mraW-like_protein n=2 Tax=Leishmania infantum TaxID=5671 RepID=A0A6L0XGU7_LEIIN|nr:S-adenosyl-methyltransferase mraW-like protein [Leishmania infantum JPCM5]CAC9489971.1 S-adenosyl-methyltransferase_mraW-like_protein [Leishmania infantum]CAM68246.1 S-adenosyl-methyltransferase mraW-like protein [Leishmania infantum JPCM5]SUZ42022.1 S-adenosyl-methyltransferase_mraW-like_protein [Leishmania infantum]|eukprot:XP_001465817.1 S-adenosyl-methyltransferase mraW-like protein [Leishmania infantum JPCM5]